MRGENDILVNDHRQYGYKQLSTKNKFSKFNKNFYQTTIRLNIPNGYYEFEEDLSNEDQKVIYIKPE